MRTRTTSPQRKFEAKLSFRRNSRRTPVKPKKTTSLRNSGALARIQVGTANLLLPRTRGHYKLLDRFTQASSSRCDPTATKSTTFRRLSHSCISGERKLTNVVKLIEQGPNIKPVFSTAARDTHLGTDDDTSEYPVLSTIEL